MIVRKQSPLYDEFFDYLVSKATPDEILAFKPSVAAQERADELSERHKTGLISLEESEELTQLIELETLVAMLKAKAVLAKLQ